MRQGEIVREVKDKAEMTEENLMRLMIGVDE